ncbi:hypothetical protein [Amycolatopsis suaedae]|uniref:Pyrrolo-quinoline quinone n=1 Tax=Amycolatopsis suaedae TaxID=2510978 RepID=A0A4Q7J486_9PSEU|nr:hypothetical protein [Amycolatopsis suaedae]RZQ62350.1 hypothetical protein EWH70_18935 [Amycolatopsis suaedae]
MWGRRKPVVLAAAVVVVVALGVVVIGRLDGGDAPSGFDVAWQNPMPGKATGDSAPVVVGDALVLADADALTALDVATGGVRWTVPTMAEQYCGSAASADAVYLNLRVESEAGRPCRTLVRIGPDGRETWRSRIEGALPERQSPDGRTLWETPAAIGARPDGVIIVTGRMITAFSAAGGPPKWTHLIPANDWGDSEYGRGCRFVDAAIGVDAIATRIGCAEPAFAASENSAVLELRAVEDGAVRHRGPVTSIRDHALLHASGAGVVTTGWSATGARLAFFDAQLRQTAVYPHSVPPSAGTASLEEHRPRGPRQPDVEISGDLLIALGANRRPVAVRISTGQVEWRADDGVDAGCGGLVWDGALLTCGPEKSLSAYDLATGDLESGGIEVDGVTGTVDELTSSFTWNRMIRVGDRVVALDDKALVGLERA